MKYIILNIGLFCLVFIVLVFSFVGTIFFLCFLLSNFCQTNSQNDTDQSAFVTDVVVTNRTTQIILANLYSNKAEIYQITFTCGSDYCTPLPLDHRDLLWSSPDTSSISEVKFVSYNGLHAVLCTTDNGAIVYAYPAGTVLFHKELESSYYVNVHSAEVLPDGNVAIAGSMVDGIIAVLYPDGSNVTQSIADTVSIRFNTLRYCHGVVYDKWRNGLYCGCYLTLLSLRYNSGSDGRGSFDIAQNISVESYYNEINKDEDPVMEDGIHDLYPLDNSTDALFMTTGEHVFVISVENFSINYFQNLYTIPSKHSRTVAVAVPDKGGVKAISMDATNDLVVAKASPFFRELCTDEMDLNYSPFDPVLLWTMPKESTDGFCLYPTYDYQDKCKVNFDNVQPIMFYKARIFRLPVLTF